jgi:hypothetical protein
MAERISEMGSRYKLSKTITLQPITGSETEIAVSHEINRQCVVKELLVHTFFMAKYRLIDDDLTAGAAGSQYFSSKNPSMAAAHCVPGQISYNAEPIQKAVSASARLLVDVDTLFGKTDEIDRKFNTADQRAEENGLIEAFRSACARCASDAKHARFNRAIEMYPFISTAFGVYKSFGVRAFQMAATRQRALMRPRDPADVAAREVTIAILGVYQNELQTADDSLETVQGLFPEDIWKEYKVFR